MTRLLTYLEPQSGVVGSVKEVRARRNWNVILARMKKLKRALQNVGTHRRGQRDARRAHVGLPVVALIRYTNADKGKLLNALTWADVLAAHAPFATWYPTERRAWGQGMNFSLEKLVTDTVGFVLNFPTQVVVAFRVKLEEVEEADLVKHVVDGSVDTAVMIWQMTTVEEVGGGGKRLRLL